MIRRVTSGPRLEVCARKPHEGFEPHGNEVEQKNLIESPSLPPDPTEEGFTEAEIEGDEAA